MSVTTSIEQDRGRGRAGRAPTTTRAQLSAVGLRLFIERGFDAVTVDDIAREAGIARRTFFRYFASKNDLPWGEFDILLAEMSEYLAVIPNDVPLFEAIRDAVIAFNTYPEAELAHHRDRMRLLFTVPTLAAHGTLRYQAWRDVIAGFAARRLGHQPADLTPQTIGWAFLAASLVGYEQWLGDAERSLTETLAAAHDVLREIGDL